ncbi:MAG TPA: TetR/AcrR family transcriptional regulator [Allocoleopsis sp.]
MSNISLSKTSSQEKESRKTKGQTSRETILLTATKLATLKGLSGLSLADLAAEVGMSKSGLYAHFKDKEELELATIEMAIVIFDREVFQPAMEAPVGIERLRALANAFLSHLERRVFPGGCFFAAVTAELDTRPGSTHDRVAEVLDQWLSLLKQCLLDAQERGEINSNTEVDQAVFEIEGMLLAANYLFVMANNPIHLLQGRTGVENVLARLVVNSESKQQQSPRGTLSNINVSP